MNSTIAFPKHVVHATRPVDVPAHWMILRAPRPIRGTVHLPAPFPTFFVAIDPADELAVRQLQYNFDMEAREVVYMTRDEVQVIGRQWYSEHYPDKVLEEIVPADHLPAMLYDRGLDVLAGRKSLHDTTKG